MVLRRPPARRCALTLWHTILWTGIALIVLKATLAARAAPLPQGEEPPPFRGEERVTVIDVMVDLPQPHTLLPFDDPPDAGDLRVELDGRTLPVLAIDPPPAKRGEAPWSFLLYFDLVLSDRSQLSWAADLLSARLPELTRMGRVEIVVADPEPRTVVSPTRDVGPLDAALEQMIFFPEAEDALVEARLVRAAEAGSSPAPSAPASAGDSGGPTPLERALVRDRLDRLVLAAADRTDGTTAPRRALFLVTGGFELDESGSLEGATDEAAETLAGYGWTILPVLEPPPKGTVPGLRIGKWHLYKPSREALLTVPAIFTATRESERDPERAAAFLELAQARQRQGDLDGAARAARRAMTHFADDPRTAEQQARALLILAEVYEARGHDHLARRTYLRAATRDPEALADHPMVAAAVDRPHEALERLARATLGAVVRGDREWDPALQTLDRRGLVSIQRTGLPDGRLHEVQGVRRTSGKVVPAAGSVRFGTPRTVVAARARQLLADVPEEGELPVSATLSRPAEPGGAPTLAVRADPSRLPGDRSRPDSHSGPDEAALLRVTLARPVAGGSAEVLHLDPVILSPRPTAPWSWELRREIAPGDGEEWGIVVVDDLLTGAWGAALAQPPAAR